MNWKLYYDGECNLCHGSQLQVVKWASKFGQPIETAILQSEESVQKGYSSEEMVLEADHIYRAEQAWLKLMTVAPWYLRWCAFFGALPGINFLTRLGYRFVAKYRKKFFKKRACELPSRH